MIKDAPTTESRVRTVLDAEGFDNETEPCSAKLNFWVVCREFFAMIGLAVTVACIVQKLIAPHSVWVLQRIPPH